MNQQIKEFLIQYYSGDIEYYRPRGLPDTYRAAEWIAAEGDVQRSFARYIEFLLTEVDSGSISYHHIVGYSRDFYCRCLRDHKILLREIQKRDPVFGTLFIDCMYEVDAIGEPHCNTNRGLIDLFIRQILSPDSVFEEFEALSRFSWNHICLSDRVKHESISDYLVRCLEYPDHEAHLDRIIECLGYQRNVSFLSIISAYLYPEFPVEESWPAANQAIQSSAIAYLQRMDLPAAVDCLRELESSGKLYKENLPGLRVALCKHTAGADGLLKLFQEANDWELKYGIVECYEIYRAKKFAQFLIDCLTDDTILENGYYPVRNIAHEYLVKEEYAKLIEWFGTRVIDTMDGAILES
ncbi:MAG: hypothetical protein NXI24_10660 [bacterium]|nr:hypothetical protein [bacterium]